MGKQIRLETTVSPELAIAADRVRFKQILYNLLSNAIKFTPEDGLVRFEGVADGTIARFRVSDTGVGIRAEDLDLIFEEFRQVGESSRGVREGTGLGLAITRRLVEQHGGTIAVTSEVGVGTEFTFTLPLVTMAPATSVLDIVSAAVPVARSSAQPLVLIVDDEPTACELLASFLAPEGYATETASSAEEAMRKVRSLRPAAITLDILMPSGSGWAILYDLKNDPATESIPIIVVSIVDHRKLGMTLGATEYLVKPVQKQTLLDAMRRHVRPEAVCRCLAVDDDPQDLRLIEDVLVEAGCSVRVARNGKQAIQSMQSHPTDLVLLDLVMPEMDGFEVIRRMKEDDVLKCIPVIVLTAKDLTKEEQDLIAASTRALLAKHRDWQAKLLQDVRQVVAPKSVLDGSSE